MRVRPDGEERELLRLPRGDLGEAPAAVAGVDDEQAGEAVDVALAGESQMWWPSPLTMIGTPAPSVITDWRAKCSQRWSLAICCSSASVRVGRSVVVDMAGLPSGVCPDDTRAPARRPWQTVRSGSEADGLLSGRASRHAGGAGPRGRRRRRGRPAGQRVRRGGSAGPGGSAGRVRRRAARSAPAGSGPSARRASGTSARRASARSARRGAARAARPASGWASRRGCRGWAGRVRPASRGRCSDRSWV